MITVGPPTCTVINPVTAAYHQIQSMTELLGEGGHWEKVGCLPAYISSELLCYYYIGKM